MSFSRFMEHALYAPGGYYRRADSPLGTAGDYYTSVTATPLFGRILARYFQYLRDRWSGPNPFGIIEFGGHRGQLRDDVLREVPDLPYRVIEVGEPLPDELWGCVFSNELLDAMPVHRVRARGGVWRELYVSLDPATAGTFCWVEGPLSESRLGEQLAGLPAPLMEGYETEVHLATLDWMEAVARRLRRGHIVSIDYGFTRTEYYSPQRPLGTLRGYRRHRVIADPLADAGGQDLTAHVEFTSLIEAGERVGLRTIQFTDLTHFLLEHGAGLLREISDRTAGTISRERQAIHQLLHPGFMGESFRVLVQARD